MIYKVVLSPKAEKQVRYCPSYILDKLLIWIQSVKRMGLENVRKISGFHDESLHGKRRGERSVRLNRAYRAIYTIEKDVIEFIEVQEVTKHEY